MKKWIALLLAFALLAAIGCTRQRPAASTQTSAPAAQDFEPEPEPDVTQAPEPAAAQTPEPEATPEPEFEPEPPADGTPEPNCFDALLGDWEIASVEMGGVTQDAAALGLQSTVTFLANGAGLIQAQARGEETEQIFTFGVYGTWIQMHDEENTAIDAYYDAETDTLRMIPEEGVSLTLTRKTEPDPTPAPESEPEPDWTQAALAECEDNGNRMVSITATIPPHATLRIDFAHQDDYMRLNDSDTFQIRKIKIPVEVFYPNTPTEYAELEITPALSIIDEAGKETQVACPSFTVELPALSITFPDAPEDEPYTIKAKADGSVQIVGTVSDETATVTVDNREIVVYEGGVFIADLAPVGPEQLPYTVTVVAMKNNFVIVSAEVTVAP